MLKAELEQEVNRLRAILDNPQECFKSLSPETKTEIDNIFNTHYNPDRPATRFAAIGEIAAYVIREACQ
ncbi:hypothetical protein FBR42_13710 [Salmonella enterica subsp. enterica serovar Hull]|nr:hypothetical protein [Salmonella enterica]EBS6328163.1 hypothetical protein [Salmonella enterica subsp. enterica serovar Virchow]ECC3449545.1 hypothetical protein [Salmonella enterica subsp. enterica serovar Javiana]ECG7219800.1 hypothetical protein [Salmonella enterica subsp. enterica serovar Hull]ECH9478884.1 hypothetical protein [Salmonella enterica subsp. enterica]EDW6387259.1 hypothetical protein [Salmonella enterica subsp. enterica serovar Java]